MNDLFVADVRLPDGQPADLLIRGGRIEAVAPRQEAPEGMERLAGRGRLALPGAIDMHVHFREPGAEHKETLLSGAHAAAKGGTTTVGDMPNTRPPTTTLARLEDKIARAAEAPITVLFNFGAEPGRLEELRRAVDTGRVRALKVYLGPSTGVGGLAPDVAREAMALAASLGLPVMVHAEDVALIEQAAARHPHDARHHHLLRPLEAELSAVETALHLAEETGARLCLCHVTSARVLERVEASAIRGRVFVEVCPHHLLLSVDDIGEPAPNRFRVNPPLREEPERAALFAALRERIDGLATDHAPHTLHEKEAPYDEAPSGIPGVEHLLPIALTWWREGVISLERLVALTSGHAAGFFGLNKGRLEPGRDGDLVLVDPEREWILGEGDDRVHSLCGWTPYAGRRMRGRIEATVSMGRIVYTAPSDAP